MMTAVREVWASSGESLSQNGLGRAISSEVLRQCAALAKKYVAGMKAQESETGIAALDTLADFASGAWDGFLTQARDETMSAYWPWVLEAVEKKTRARRRRGGRTRAANGGKSSGRGGTIALRGRATQGRRVRCRRSVAKPPGRTSAKVTDGRRESSRGEFACSLHRFEAFRT